MKLVAKPAGRPNGIALSPNGRILYVANSDEHNVRAYDLDRNGDASNERVLISGIAGVPDGIARGREGQPVRRRQRHRHLQPRRQAAAHHRRCTDAAFQLRVRRGRL